MKARRSGCAGRAVVGFLTGILVGLGLGAPGRADIVVLDIRLDETDVNATFNGPGSFHVRARVWGDGGVGTPPTSLGIGFFYVDVAGTEGATVSALRNDAIGACGKWGPVLELVNYQAVGFKVLVSHGPPLAAAGQDTIYGPVPDPVKDEAVIEGLGIVGGSGTFFVPTAPFPVATVSWDADFLLASGIYTGNTGSVELTGMEGESAPASFLLLPNDGSGSWHGPSGQSPPSTITWAKLMIPEPSTIVLLGLGGLAVLRRRRRAPP